MSKKTFKRIENYSVGQIVKIIYHNYLKIKITKIREAEASGYIISYKVLESKMDTMKVGRETCCYLSGLKKMQQKYIDRQKRIEAINKIDYERKSLF